MRWGDCDRGLRGTVSLHLGSRYRLPTVQYLKINGKASYYDI